MFIKKNPNVTKISEVVSENTGLSIKEFLNPVSNPDVRNLKEGVELLKSFRKKPVKIVADYDVDGVCGLSILDLGLQLYGIQAITRIPYRFSEGYGLSESIIDEIGEPGALLLTVDNGITAVEAIEKAKKIGMTVIVIDHHLPIIAEGSIKLPAADIIIDPNAYEEESYKDYCGAGLAYRFIKELLPNEDLSDLLVLASLATVCDIMNLTGANHWLVKEGLRLINQGKGTKGLRALIQNEKKEGIITEKDFGFLFGPIINASGRLEDEGATRSFNLVHENKNDPTTQAQLYFRALKMHAINEERKKIVKDALKDLNFTEKNVVLYDPDLCEGIVGLVASNLCERTKSPAIVFTKSENGLLKGSGRSIKQIHLKNVLDEMQPLIEKYGGHAGAAGVTIKEENLEKFRETFKKICVLPEEKDDVYYDLELDLFDLQDTYQELTKYAPYGKGNPNISYYVKLKNFSETFVGEEKNHLQIVMTLPTDETISFIGFNLREKFEELGKPKSITCVGTLEKKNYQGKESYSFQMIDIESGE